MRRLRGRGFTEIMFGDDAAPYAVLRRLPADEWSRVFDDWIRLTPWRRADPWWEGSLRASDEWRGWASAGRGR
ncbi:hypothetical protein ACFVJ3_41905 [Rhodococcus sp. NPDC127593]|uniref:hypothetical protein n=1 Tax=Rhodococcus sp. NPDC127593 TaxID=3345404 RepID=UPI00363926C9